MRRPSGAARVQRTAAELKLQALGTNGRTAKAKQEAEEQNKRDLEAIKQIDDRLEHPDPGQTPAAREDLIKRRTTYQNRSAAYARRDESPELQTQTEDVRLREQRRKNDADTAGGATISQDAEAIRDHLDATGRGGPGSSGAAINQLIAKLLAMGWT